MGYVSCTFCGGSSYHFPQANVTDGTFYAWSGVRDVVTPLASTQCSLEAVERKAV